MYIFLDFIVSVWTTYKQWGLSINNVYVIIRYWINYNKIKKISLAWFNIFLFLLLDHKNILLKIYHYDVSKRQTRSNCLSKTTLVVNNVIQI